MIAKFKQSQNTHLARIYMAVIHLAQFKTDILISLNQVESDPAAILRTQTLENYKTFGGFKHLILSSFKLENEGLFTT